MVSESEKYGAGLSGYGGVDYASASWRAGDLERARLQRQATDARNRAPTLEREKTEARNPAASGTYSESSRSGFTVFAVLAFVVAGFYGIGETVEYFIPNVRQEMLPYIGPDGFVSRNVFFLILVASLSTIGFLLRKILRWVLGIGIALALVGGAISLFLNG